MFKVDETNKELIKFILDCINVGINTIEKGETFSPFIITEIDGERRIQPLTGKNNDEVTQAAFEIIKNLNKTPDYLALGYKGILGDKEGIKNDAIMIKGYDKNLKEGFVFGQRYQPKKMFKKFQTIGKPGHIDIEQNMVTAIRNPQKEEKPKLQKATAYKKGDIGKVEWNIEHNKKTLVFSNKNQTVEWNPDNGKLAFVPATTSMHLHSGKFTWDFNIEEMNSAQIGVGFMLLWDNGLLDWGMFGYLGAGASAWSYDPSTGDIVRAENSIQGGLPKFEDGHTGIITVKLNLPRDAEGEGKFIVNGVESNPINLPPGAVIVPAACMLKEKQKITLENFNSN